MSTPAISVVMGVFNEAAVLAPTLDSILAQTERDFELIVVNDGSTDPRVGEILAEYARRDARLRVLTQANAGLTRALIDGCARASAPWIARQDADDVSLPGRLAALFPVNRERLAAVGANGIERDLDASELAAFRAESWFPKLIGALRAETLTLAAGQPPEFQRILAAWDAWYQSLLDLPVNARENATGRVEFPAEMRKRSAALLQGAQGPLHAYRQRVRGLARYVDDFEERSAAANIPETADTAPGPRTEHQQYVDQFDTTRPKPPPPPQPPATTP